VDLKGQHIGRIFTFLAGLIILAHAVVPHHHHFDSIETHPENIDCENTRTDKHNENPDKHCHAFNLIISNKANDLVVNTPAESNFYFDLFCVESNHELTVRVDDPFKTCFFVSAKQMQIFLTSRSLRAPPATA
jgi:hypothetical protein